MDKLHCYTVISGIILASSLALNGCVKSANQPVNPVAEPQNIEKAAKVEETPSEPTPKSVKLLMNEGFADCDNDYQDEDGIIIPEYKSYNTKDDELLKLCNSSHVDLEKVEALIADGVDLNESYFVNMHYYTPLEVLCSRSDIDEDALRFLVEHGADINLYSESGLTPIMAACNRKNIDKSALKLLIELGADVNAGNKSNNDNAAMMATDRACYDRGATKMLLEAGTDVNKVAKNNTTLLHSAIRDAEISRQILEMGASPYSQAEDGEDALSLAAWCGTPESVSLMISKGLDVNRVLPDGLTALLYAGLGNKLDVIKTLVDAGADLNVLTRDGDSLLTVACYKADSQRPRAGKVQPDVIRYLIEQGLDVNHASNNGWTPLMVLVQSEYDVSEAVNLLLDAGADINHIANGNTPLSLAQNVNVAKLLIDRGADVSASGTADALITAAVNDNIDLVKLYVERGVDASQPAKNGMSILAFARSVEVAEYLMTYGAKMHNNAKNGEAFMTDYLRANVDDVWIYRKYGPSPLRRGNRGKISDDLLMKISRTVLYFLKKGAETDEDSLPYRALAETLLFEDESDYQKLYDLYISKNTISRRRGNPTVLEEILSSSEFPGVKLSPTPDLVKKFIEMQGGTASTEELQAYLNNNKVTHDPGIIKMLMDAGADGSRGLSAYFLQDDVVPEFRVIEWMINAGVEIESYHLIHYLEKHSDHIDQKIVGLLVANGDVDDSLLGTIISREADSLKPETIDILLNSGIKGSGGELYAYLSSCNKEPDINVIKKLLSVGGGQGYTIRGYLNNKDVTHKNEIIRLLLDADTELAGDEIVYYLGDENIPKDEDIAGRLAERTSQRIALSAYTRKVGDCEETIPGMVLIAEKMPELLLTLSAYAQYSKPVVRECVFTDETPLMKVVSNPEIVKALVDGGADVNAKTSSGETALSLAIKGGYTKSAEILRNAGAKE